MDWPRASPGARRKPSDHVLTKSDRANKELTKLTSNSPVNPLSVRGRLRDVKIQPVCVGVKTGRFCDGGCNYSFSLYTRVLVKRTSILYESGNDSLNEK